jgi:hypothetical protein
MLDAETISISFNETTSVNDINQIIAIFAEATGKDTITVNQLANNNQMVPENLVLEDPLSYNMMFSTTIIQNRN